MVMLKKGRIGKPPVHITIFVSKPNPVAYISKRHAFKTPQQRPSSWKRVDFLKPVYKMWLVATPKQMGHLRSRLGPYVLTVVLGTEHYPAASRWITD